MPYTYLPTLNAVLNAISAAFLLLGYNRIRNRRIEAHKKSMLAALVASALFLTSYLIYHIHVGDKLYLHHDWTRPVYFAILIPHVILATVNVPFILLLVWHVWKGNFFKHRRLARWVWPSWMFVSVSGVVVYLMLYHL